MRGGRILQFCLHGWNWQLGVINTCIGYCNLTNTYIEKRYKGIKPKLVLDEKYPVNIINGAREINANRK